MNKISKLLQEAKPLYHRRKAIKRTITYNGLVVVAILITCPVVLEQYKNRTVVNDLYAELYPSVDTNSGYYIDEFDALGII